ncbi:MAG: MBL fold metallo-hydrolase [Dehalococcoidia bacterium]
MPEGSPGPGASSSDPEAAVPARVTVRRWGAPNGDRMVVDVAAGDGLVVHGIGVEPPEGATKANGPTWAYLVDDGGLTLIDPGHLGSLEFLADGMAVLGLRPADVERVVVTHGHWDHDGGVAEFLDVSGAEFWAHELWQPYASFSYSRLLREDGSPLRAVMARLGEGIRREAERTGERVQGPGGGQQEYVETRGRLRVDRALADGDRHGALEFLHTPGHWPDELTIRLGDVVLTGDHVLPEITPHPSMRYEHPAEMAASLPERHRDASDVWGLGAYLRSLRRVEDLGRGLPVLPAHRLFNRGRFLLVDNGRAGETIEHHRERLERLWEIVAGGEETLEGATRALFTERPLRDGYHLMSAVSETISHVELLQDTGDMEVGPDARLRSTGSRDYRDFLGELGGDGRG